MPSYPQLDNAERRRLIGLTCSAIVTLHRPCGQPGGGWLHVVPQQYLDEYRALGVSPRGYIGDADARAQGIRVPAHPRRSRKR